MKIKLFVVAFVALCLTSGVSFGHSITQTEIDQIRPGYTTGSDLVRLFGQPTTFSTDVFKTTSLEWFYSSPPCWEGYLPMLGSSLGGLEVEIQDLWVEVGANGKVRSYTINELDGWKARTNPPVGYSK